MLGSSFCQGDAVMFVVEFYRGLIPDAPMFCLDVDQLGKKVTMFINQLKPRSFAFPLSQCPKAYPQKRTTSQQVPLFAREANKKTYITRIQEEKSAHGPYTRTKRTWIPSMIWAFKKRHPGDGSHNNQKQHGSRGPPKKTQRKHGAGPMADTSESKGQKQQNNHKESMDLAPPKKRRRKKQRWPRGARHRDSFSRCRTPGTSSCARWAQPGTWKLREWGA